MVASIISSIQTEISVLRCRLSDLETEIDRLASENALLREYVPAKALIEIQNVVEQQSRIWYGCGSSAGANMDGQKHSRSGAMSSL